MGQLDVNDQLESKLHCQLVYGAAPFPDLPAESSSTVQSSSHNGDPLAVPMDVDGGPVAEVGRDLDEGIDCVCGDRVSRLQIRRERELLLTMS